MNKYYILSGMDEENDYNFYEDIAEIFRKELKSFESIVYISAYPKDIERNKKLSKSEKFINAGINFRNSIALDYSYDKENALPIHEHGIFLHLIVSSLISFSSVL